MSGYLGDHKDTIDRFGFFKGLANCKSPSLRLSLYFQADSVFNRVPGFLQIIVSARIFFGYK